MKIKVTQIQGGNVSKNTCTFRSEQNFNQRIENILSHVMNMEKQVEDSGEPFMRKMSGEYLGFISDSLQTLRTKDYIEWTVDGVTTLCQIIRNQDEVSNTGSMKSNINNIIQKTMKFQITQINGCNVSKDTYTFRSEQIFNQSVQILLSHVMNLEKHVEDSGEPFMRKMYGEYWGFISDSLQTLRTKYYIEWTIDGVTTQYQIIRDQDEDDPILAAWHTSYNPSTFAA